MRTGEIEEDDFFFESLSGHSSALEDNKDELEEVDACEDIGNEDSVAKQNQCVQLESKSDTKKTDSDNITDKEKTGDTESATKDNSETEVRKKSDLQLGEDEEVGQADDEDESSSQYDENDENEIFNEINENKSVEIETENAEEEGVDLIEALTLKEDANKQFKDSLFAEALITYERALDKTPSREKETAAIILANMAACHLGLKQFDEVIDRCTECIELNPEYIKAYLRRFRAQESKQKYHDALTDLKTAVEKDPSLLRQYAGVMSKLERQSAEQFEKEKAEMLGKMKEFGNWALGKVGLSLDNFKVEQNPDTGSYNIQFKQNEPNS